MTRFNNKYPYTDFHELNADWLLETVKEAEAEAKEASDTVATYNDRLTTVEGDLAPIKSAMPGIASSISDLTSGLGRVSSQVTTNTQDIADNASNIDNIEDRLTTYDQNFIDINNQFISDQGRIRELETYRTEAQVKIGNLGYSFAPLFDEDAGYNAGDYVMSPTLKLHRARVNIPAGTADIHDLTQFQPTDINNALHEGALPLVTSADAGDVLTVDSNGDWVAATPGGGGETRTPITVTPNIGGITILNNRSYYTDKDIVIDVYVNTTSPRTGAYILAISSTALTALNSILPIDVNEIDPNAYTAITGCGGSLSLYDANDKWINVTCPAAGLLHIYGVYAKAV